MTQERYDEILILEKEYRTHNDSIILMKKGLNNLESKQTKITRDIMDKCDHEYPDGRSALDSHFYHQCEICGAII